MNMMKAVASLVLTGMAVTTIAFAGPRSKEVNTRLKVQRHRIHQGVKSGELTKREAVKLRAEGKAIRTEEKIMKKTGGGLSKRETRVLNRQLNTRSRQIYRMKHNDRTR